MDCVLVTKNAGKIAEFQQLFQNTALQFRSLKEIGFEKEIVETGTTFEENSKLKVEQVSSYTNMALMSDDSGLEVDGLAGDPGVFSARYSGENATDGENIEKLLFNLKGVDERKARFVCVLTFKLPDGMVQVRGECEGSISHEIRGSGGFGYDPVFIPNGYQQTFGELPAEVKSKMSHRAKAVELLLAQLKP